MAARSAWVWSAHAGAPDVPLVTAEDLLAAAGAARENAYAPYSTFAVGAAVRAASGRIFASCNVENASYPVGTCAEAGAIAAMIAAGERHVIEVLVLGAGPRPLTPCGACRQRLAEFAGADTQVHAADPTGVRATFTLGALLPEAFSLDARVQTAEPAANPAELNASIRHRL